MELNVKHYGRIERGKKKYYNPDLYQRQILSLEGREFCEVITERKKKPSTDQHAYYRGGILGTCIKTEYFAHFNDEEQIHEDFFAPMFLSYSVQIITPKESYIQKKVRSTADLSRKEYAEFIDKVIMWCAENGIEILSPDDYYQTYYKTVYKNGK